MFDFYLRKASPRFTFDCYYLGRKIHEEPHVSMSQIAAYMSDLSALSHPGDEFRIFITSEDPVIVDGFSIGEVV